MNAASVLGRMGRGALGGIVGTAGLSLVTTAARRAGLIPELPPRTMTRYLMTRFSGRRPSERTTTMVTTIGHYAYGVAVGVPFSLFAPRKMKVLAGAAWGALVWASSYAGWIPAVGFLPPPHRDRRGRPPTMILAHLVYGALLGALS